MAKSRKSTKTNLGSGNRELLTWAMHGLEQEIATTRARLQQLESQARQLRASTRGAAAESSAAPAAGPAAASKPARKRRKLSADARRRIAEAQKRRWAKARASKE